MKSNEYDEIMMQKIHRIIEAKDSTEVLKLIAEELVRIRYQMEDSLRPLRR